MLWICHVWTFLPVFREELVVSFCCWRWFNLLTFYWSSIDFISLRIFC
jgi:hypothetical protein